MSYVQEAYRVGDFLNPGAAICKEFFRLVDADHVDDLEKAPACVMIEKLA
jgi:hypothetical protein